MATSNQAVTVTDAAAAHEPAGDPDHVAYGKDYRWECTCGRSSAYLTTFGQAQSRGRQHARYCTGEVTVDTVGQ